MKIGYARISTEEQNLTLQINTLEAAGCDEIHKDAGFSGISISRPGLDAVLSRLESGDTLVVWRLDRLGRSLVHLAQTINELDTRGVHFQSLTEYIDTGSSGGRLVFHILAAMAEFERSLISERTRAGMRAAKASGRQVGRPSSLSKGDKRAVLKAIQDGEPRKAVAQRFGVSLRTIERLSCLGGPAKRKNAKPAT